VTQTIESGAWMDGHPGKASLNALAKSASAIQAADSSEPAIPPLRPCRGRSYPGPAANRTSDRGGNLAFEPHPSSWRSENSWGLPCWAAPRCQTRLPVSSRPPSRGLLASAPPSTTPPRLFRRPGMELQLREEACLGFGAAGPEGEIRCLKPPLAPREGPSQLGLAAMWAWDHLAHPRAHR